MIPFSTVYFEIVGVCNAKCKWCATGIANRSNNKRNFTYITPEAFENAIIYLKTQNIVSEQALFGLYNYGESFLHPQFAEIIGVAEKHSIRYRLSTNASVIPPGFRETTYENLQSFTFSMPGFSQNSYDRIHGFDFSKIKDNMLTIYENMKERGFKGKAQLSFHVYQFNLNELEAAERFAIENDFTFYPNVAIIADLEKYYEYLTSTIDYNTLKEIGEDLFLYYINDLRRDRPEHYACPQIYNALAIDEQLNVLTCCGIDPYMEDTKLGNLYEMTIEELQLRKKSAKFCTKCQREGIDYLFHNQLPGIALISPSRKHKHELRDTDGNILPCQLRIDLPKKQGQLVKNSSNSIRGWCLYGGHIDKIEIYFNDVLHGEALYGTPRSDVYAAYPAYKDTHSGYIYNFNTINLPPSQTPDNNKIKVIAYAQDNIVAQSEVDMLSITE